MDTLNDIFKEFKESKDYIDHEERTKNFVEGWEKERDLDDTMERYLQRKNIIPIDRKRPMRFYQQKYAYQGWITRRPGSQATGSFHPTNYNYFGEDQEDIIHE